MTIVNLQAYNYRNRFNKYANDDFLASSEESILVPDNLRGFIEKHKADQRPRLEYLERYYLNQNDDVLINIRRLDTNENKADHRAAHNYAKYVSQFIVGYQTGNPITVTHEEESLQAMITEVNDLNDVDAINSEIALNLSIYGRAYEVAYRNHDDEDRFLPLDPKNTFVIYNADLDKKLLAGVRYYDVPQKDGSTLEFADVFTATEVHSLAFKDGEYHSYSSKPHYYNEVPITEYINDKFKQGDFENVISLIDLYDNAQSDTANYMTDLNDAMLAIVGDAELDGDDALKFRAANMIHIKPKMMANGGEGKADVKYIYKQYDVSGSEAYKKRLEQDIHKFTNTPDLNDENFSGTQSGESMKYKLFGLEQKRATKERYFKKGLMKRYRLIERIRHIENSTNGDVSDIQIIFTPNLPKALKESVDIFNALNGGVSEETRLSLLDFIDNPQEEIERMREEQEEQRQASDTAAYPELTKGDEVNGGGTDVLAEASE